MANLSPRTLGLVGHLVITIPVVVIIVLISAFSFIPGLIGWYYVIAAIAVGWQWYAMALPRWKLWAAQSGVAKEQVEDLAQRAALQWPGAGTVGPFALHTAAALLCAIHFCPWLVGRWFAWILPLTGHSTTIYPGDFFLQHIFAIVMIPTMIVGYLVALRWEKAASWAWFFPTAVFACKLLTFTPATESVFGGDDLPARFVYFFGTIKHMPTLLDWRGADPVRVSAQMFVVAPFYAGIAYSLGAIAAKHDVLGKLHPAASESPAERV